MFGFILKIFPCVLCFLKSFVRKLFLGSRSSSSPSAGNNDLVYEPPPESHPSASSSYPIEVVVDSVTVKPQHVQSSSQRTDQISQKSKESGPLLPIFSSKQPTLSCTPLQSPSKPSPSSSNIPQSSLTSSSVTAKPQHVQSSSQSITNEVSHSSKVSSPVPPTISSRLLQSPSKPSPSSSNIPQSPLTSSSVTVKPQHVQSSSQSITNEVSHSSKVSSPVPPTISSTPLQSPSKPSASSNNLWLYHLSQLPPTFSSNSSNPLPPTFSSRQPADSSNLSQSSSKPPPLSSSPSPSSLRIPVDSSISYKYSPKTTEPPSASSSPTSYKPPQSSPSVVPYSSKPPPSSSGPPLYSTKQSPVFKLTLHTAPNNVTNEESKTTYVCEKGAPIYAIPEDIKDLIKEDIAPPILEQPLSPSTYKAYFAALLYAEDYYLEKVTLKPDKAVLLKSKKSKYSNGSGEEDDKIFVEFEIDSIPGRRPFLLSRDVVHARPSDKKVEPFQGFIHRVVKSRLVLVEFGDDFHSQHHPNRKYDVSFSFNRVCLKRAHQAIEAALGPSSHNFLFPECVPRKNILNPPALFDTYDELNTDEFNAVRRILSFQGSPPYLLGGPLIGTNAPRYATEQKVSARTGVVVCKAVIEIYKTSKENRILICAPINRTCDMLMRSLREVIPESDMFRANAAFREIDEVPIDILRSCPVKDECFACPPLKKLQKFKIILSTFVSSFRLHNQGIAAGHFSHIFLVDASSTTEPEATIALANFANENTSVIVTGEPGNRSGWVRSNMARKYGLRKSYFERLCEAGPYQILNPMFITELVGFEQWD
ncbi:putative rna helicase sde3 [Quercus suber]|uniref:Rna helicase sde3 n=1 Tax=Quercus suber TaxID=58331 RepID=A0AAW0JBT0_QUESU